MNINGENRLACITGLDRLAPADVRIHPLPNVLVDKDLVPDLSHCLAQYASSKPWPQTQGNPGSGERLDDLDDPSGPYRCHTIMNSTLAPGPESGEGDRCDQAPDPAAHAAAAGESPSCAR